MSRSAKWNREPEKGSFRPQSKWVGQAAQCRRPTRAIRLKAEQTIKWDAERSIAWNKDSRRREALRTIGYAKEAFAFQGAISYRRAITALRGT